MSPLGILWCAVCAGATQALGGNGAVVFTVCVCAITAWNYFTGKV